jgi:hypothetical protein
MLHTGELTALDNFNYKIHRKVNSALYCAPDIGTNGSLPTLQQQADMSAVLWGIVLSYVTPKKEVDQSDCRPTVVDWISGGAPDCQAAHYRTVRCTRTQGKFWVSLWRS